MLPVIDFGGGRLLPVVASFERASVSVMWFVSSPSTNTSLMMDVPIRILSPSFSSTLRTFSPLTNVPFVEPRSRS